MNKDEILKLVNAGYTRKEIDEMMKETPSDDSKQNEATQPEVENEAHESTNQNDAFQKSIQMMIDEFKNGMAEMKKEIQSSNLKGATIDINEEKPEDILASIINPSYKKEK